MTYHLPPIESWSDWTPLHDFGTDSIAELLDRSNTPTPIDTFEELSNTVWPDLIGITEP